MTELRRASSRVERNSIELGDQEVSLVDMVRSDPRLSVELDAASAVNNVNALIANAAAQSGVTQKLISEALGVTEGRVSQVLNDVADIRVSTLARYLSAMGFEALFDAKAPSSHLSVCEVAKARQRRREPIQYANMVSLIHIDRLSAAFEPVASIYRGSRPLDRYEVLEAEVIEDAEWSLIDV